MSCFRKEASIDGQQAPGTSVVTQVWITKWGPSYFIKRGSQVTIRRGSTTVSTVLRKSVRFFITNIFLIIKSFPSWNLAPYPTYNVEIDLYEIIRRFARLHPRRTELANILSEWLRNPGKRCASLGSGAYPGPPKKLAPSALVWEIGQY